MDEKSSPSEFGSSASKKEEEEDRVDGEANASATEVDEDEESDSAKKSFPDLPMIVMEYILAQFSYFEVLQLRLISSFWDDLVKGYLDKADEVFQHNLARHNVQWLAVKEVIEDFKQPGSEESHHQLVPANSTSNSLSKKHRNVPKMSPRYHHCACYLDESMYIFGGCIAPNTAYNDLWRFDMAGKRWHRIIAAGTPPLPRLFCSFTPYEAVDELTGERKRHIVLFGGFLFDDKLTTRDRLLGTIHLYDIEANRWTLLPTFAATAASSKSSSSQQLFLKSGNHSAVIIGDELIVFNGLRYVSTLGTDGPSPPETEVPCHQVYVYHLKQYYWRRADVIMSESPSNLQTQQQQVSPRSVHDFRSPLHYHLEVRSTLEATQPANARRKAATQTPVALDSHHILYICGCTTNVLFIAAFLLTRERCSEASCQLCQKQNDSEDSTTAEEQADTLAKDGVKKQRREGSAAGRPKEEPKAKEGGDIRWKWVPVEISKEGLDFEFTHGVEFCKVGNMMAYLTAKDVAVPVRRPPPPTPPPPPPSPPNQPSSQASTSSKSTSSLPHPPRSHSAPLTSHSASGSGSPSTQHHAPITPLQHYRGTRDHMTYSNKQLLRERRIEALDYYHRQFQQLHQQQMMEDQRRRNAASNAAAAAAQMNGNGGGGGANDNPQPPPPPPTPPSTITRHSDSPTVHRSTLQLRLLDISRVVSERRIDRVRQRHEMDYSVVPEALSAYSLVAAPDALLLFGGYYVHFNGQAAPPHPAGNGVAAAAAVAAAVIDGNGGGVANFFAGGGGGGPGPSDLSVSSKLFMISSKPEMRLF